MNLIHKSGKSKGHVEKPSFHGFYQPLEQKAQLTMSWFLCHHYKKSIKSRTDVSHLQKFVVIFPFTKNFHFAFWFDAKALFFMNRHFSFRGLFLPAVFIANLKVFIAARKPQFKWELTCNSLSLCSKGCKKVHSMNCWLGCIKLTDTFYEKQWVETLLWFYQKIH